MKHSVIMPATLAALLITGLLAGTAYSANRDIDPEATALQGAKVTLAQAIGTAEHMTGGRAYDAGVNTKGDQVQIVVETNGPKGVQTVAIDGQSGQVISTHTGGEAD
jgi:uncharacterized membrane protein YkoI